MTEEQREYIKTILPDTSDEPIDAGNPFKVLSLLRQSNSIAVSRGATVSILIPVSGWEESNPGERDKIIYNGGSVRRRDGMLEVQVKAGNNPNGTSREEEVIQKYLSDNLGSLTVDGKGEQFTEQGVRSLIAFLRNQGLTVKDTNIIAAMKMTLMKPHKLTAIKAFIGVKHKDVEVFIRVPKGSNLYGKILEEDRFVIVPKTSI